MKYKIEIMSEEEAVDFYEHYEGNDKILLISISDKKGDLNFKLKESIEVHQFYFADIEKECPGLNLMNFKQAEDIKFAVDTAIAKGIIHIIVHCYAGISRSGAVGCIIAKYLNGDDIYLWKQEGISPNRWVYKLMSKAFNLEYSSKIFRYRLKISNRLLDKRFSDYGIRIEDMFPYIKKETIE